MYTYDFTLVELKGQLKAKEAKKRHQLDLDYIAECGQTGCGWLKISEIATGQYTAALRRILARLAIVCKAGEEPILRTRA